MKENVKKKAGRNKGVTQTIAKEWKLNDFLVPLS